METEAENENPSQPNRFHLDEVQYSNIIQWNKKRKLQIDQLDFPRPKHKCWARRFSSDDNLEFASMHKFMVKSETYDSALQDSISEPKSSRGRNSFGEDSDTAMSVNEEAKLKIGFERESSYDDDDIQALMNLEEHFLALGMCSDHVY